METWPAVYGVQDSCRVRDGLRDTACCVAEVYNQIVLLPYSAHKGTSPLHRTCMEGQRDMQLCLLQAVRTGK